jgi:hypothetical protein
MISGTLHLPGQERHIIVQETIGRPKSSPPRQNSSLTWVLERARADSRLDAAKLIVTDSLAELRADDVALFSAVADQPEFSGIILNTTISTIN